MGQTLEMLLAAPEKVKKVPKSKVEIKRLTKEYGKPFFVEFKAGTLEQLKVIAENAKVNGEYNEVEEMKWVIYELCTDPNFKDSRLREAYKVTRPVDVVEEILLAGEIYTIYRNILKVSGMDKGQEGLVEEIKN